MILLSNGGTNIQRTSKPSETILVGTVDGVALLAKTDRGWAVKHRAMQGVFVSGVTALDDGTLFASTRGVGMARSEDGGFKWTWINSGLAHHEFWSCRAGKLQGRDVVFAGALPAHLYVSEDKGNTWRELKAFRDAETVAQWTFPPPPRIGHIKDIVLDGDRLWVGVEIGSLQVSKDFGKSFTELPVDPDPQECDIHRILVHPARPTIEARPDGYSLYAVDTDGQVFESVDAGDSWTIIADVPPVSKADFYKGLVRDRVKLANVDDIVANPTATKRWQEAGKAI
jgi:hypothetical protein